jgi:hypothetical protein
MFKKAQLDLLPRCMRLVVSKLVKRISRSMTFAARRL